MRVWVVALSLVVAVTPGESRQVKQVIARSTLQAELGEDGAIFISSDSGKLIKMAAGGHCLVAVFAQDKQTVGCSVARAQTSAEEHMQSQHLEIYLRNGRQSAIETDRPITDWHFWEGGLEIAVSFRTADDIGHHILYEASTGRIIEEFSEQSEQNLPQWAKNAAQIQDEAVAEGEDHDRERTAWIAKSLRRMATIKPGMKREELLKVFETEGGLSNRFQRTYVYSECPFIKVDVRFRATHEEQDGLTEVADDVIVSVSRPYLASGVMD